MLLRSVCFVTNGLFCSMRRIVRETQLLAETRPHYLQKGVDFLKVRAKWCEVTFQVIGFHLQRYLYFVAFTAYLREVWCVDASGAQVSSTFTAWLREHPAVTHLIDSVQW